MHDLKTCLSEQKFEAVLPGSSMAQSVAVLCQTCSFVSGDSKCSFRAVINRSIMLLSMNAVQTHPCGFCWQILFHIRYCLSLWLLCPGSQDRKPHPGVHQTQYNHPVKRDYYPTVLSIHAASP